MLLSGSINVVLVDGALTDVAMLRQASAPNAVVIQYNSQQMSSSAVLDQAVQAAVRRHAQIDSITLLSHGTSGEFKLGSDWISNSTLQLTVPALENLKSHLASDAKMYIYSCRVVDEGSDGQRLIDQLGNLTGASVYASTNVTGQGGDWTLEAKSSHAAALDPSSLPLNTRRLIRYQGQLNWTGATSGTTNDASHDYNNTANWSGGVINDNFSTTTLTAGTTLYFMQIARPRRE